MLEVPETTVAGPPARHSRWVRSTHWLGTVVFLVLAFTGFTILRTHPRLYWGEAGNDLMPAWLELPISKNYKHGGWTNTFTFNSQPGAPVSASRTFDIFNQNSWGRSLHFLAAWVLVAVGIVYLIDGFFTGHFRRHFLPGRAERSWGMFWKEGLEHLRLQVRPATGGPQYGLLQKCSYVAVIFIAMPLIVMTGLAMSPAVTASYPFLSDMFGGYQSARSIHFLLFIFLSLFVLIHVVMVVKSGFKRQIRSMTFGE